MFGLLTLQRDVDDEWQFAKPDAQEKVKFAAKRTAPGDELREAALLGMPRGLAYRCDLPKNETAALSGQCFCPPFTVGV
jgi:hypothetical protein